MANDNDDELIRCKGLIQVRQTDKEIREIKKMIADICINSEVNKANLINITFSFRELATSNTETHCKLFARTEKLNITMSEVKTRHSEHVRHGTQEYTSKYHRTAVIVSCVAIGVSIVTAVILAIQANVF